MDIDVSVIVPIYKGQKYIYKIIEMVQENIRYAFDKGKRIYVELIFVNDYPSENLVVVINGEFNFPVVLIENEKNLGIHQSRIKGVLKSRGKYILMLDQDDFIEECWIFSQLECIGSADMVIGNGYRMFGDKRKRIYKDSLKRTLLTNETVYLKAANQIVSPGQCLIRKNSIPSEWIIKPIFANGGDDFFLWILMFEKKMKFNTNITEIYTHVDTGENVSRNLNAMIKSARNVIDKLDEICYVNKRNIMKYQRRIDYLSLLANQNNAINRFLVHLRYIDIFVLKAIAYCI